MVDGSDELAGQASTLAAALPLASASVGGVHLQRAHATLMHRLFGDPLRPLQHGRYRLRRELGRGGMGTVWEADDPELGRRVAVKLLSIRASGSSRNSRDEVRALMREAQAIARLSHPHVVEIYDVGSAGAEAYIVMELVDGGTLASWLTGGEREHSAVVDALVQAGRGLAAAHRAGVLHRDFKPANVLRNAAGVFKVADFGLAIAPRSVDVSMPGLHVESSMDTSTEPGIAGTPAFMAPEQHAGLPLDARADQYALCVTAWLALSGSLPFTGSLASMVLAKAEGPPPRPHGRRVAPALWRILERGLAPDPKRRWPDVDALCDALRVAVRPQRRWAIAAALGLGAATIATIAAPHRVSAPACLQFERLATHWAGERDAVEGALLGTPAAERSAELLEDLDHRARAWDLAREQVCVALDDAPMLGDARIACLAAARRQLEQTTADLRAPGPDNAAHARDRIAALPDPEACAGSGQQLPLSADIARLRERLGELDAREQLARDETSLALAQSLLEEARELGDTPSIVHCDLVVARIADVLARYELADARGQEALWTALTANDDAQAFDAALVLVASRVHAVAFDDAERHARTAQSLLEHLGDDRTRAARLERALGLVASRSGRLEDGTEHFRRALATIGEDGEPPLVAQLAFDLGAAEQQRGDVASARVRFEDARRSLVAWYGPRHLEVADVELMIAITTTSEVGPRAGLLPLEHAIELYRAALPEDDPRLANALSVLGFLQAACGEHEAALAAWQAVQRSHATSAGPTHARTLAAAANVAAELVELGRIDEAEPLVLGAIEGLHAAGEYGVGHLALALDVRARIEEQRGHRARAIELWTESIEHARAFGDPELAIEPTTRMAAALVAAGEHARARSLLGDVLAAAAPKPSLRRAAGELVLADAMWREPAQRRAARALVESARATVIDRQGPTATLARMDAWLRAHP